MRIFWFCLIAVFALAGLVFGALNGEAIGVDFYFFSLHLPKGACLLSALLLGWLVGGLVVYCGLVLRLRRQLRAARKPAAPSTALVEVPPAAPTDAA